MFEDGEDLDSIKQIMDDYQAGKTTLLEAGERIERELPGSMAAALYISAGVLEASYAGRVDPVEARRIVFLQADRHPILPELFINCSLAVMDDQRIQDTVGYTALAAEKSRVHMESEEVEDLLDGDQIPFVRKVLREHPEMATAWPYLEDAGAHLVKHFLVQDASSAEGYLDPDLVEEIMNRPGDVGPVMANMCADLASLEEGPPPSWVLMARLLGELRPPEAVEAMIAGLEMIFDEDLHEAVLTLVKLAADYPDDVSSLMKGVLIEPWREEVRLNAIEVLGFRWREQGNLVFLQVVLQTLDTEDQDFDEMFRFLTRSLLRTGLPGAVDEVTRALDKYGRQLEPETAGGTRRLLEAFEPFEDDRAERLMREDVYDLCCGPMGIDARMDRMTITLMRETSLSGDLDELLERSEEDEGPPAEWVKVGRNEPCPCGSGKKFKKCCLAEVESAAAARRGEDRGGEDSALVRLIEKMLGFAQSRFRGEFESAMGEFLKGIRLRELPDYDDTKPVALDSIFVDWVLFGRLAASGRTFAAEFEEARGARLPADEALMLKATMEGRFSLFEVLDVYPEEGLRLRDVFRGDVLEVRERLATRSLVKWDIIGCRVGSMGEHREIVGSVFPVPTEDRESVGKYAKRKAREAAERGEASDMDEFLERKGYLLAGYVNNKIIEMVNRPMPTVVTPEGDRYCRCVARYEVADVEAVARALAKDPWIEAEPEAAPAIPGAARKAAKAGEREYAWFLSPESEDALRAGEHIGPFMPSVEEMAVSGDHGPDEEGQKRLFGRLSLAGGGLTFDTQSRERLEFGKARLANLTGDCARHLLDTIEDQEPLMEEAWAGDASAPPSPAGGIPPEVERQVVEEYLGRMYSTWPDTPLPALGGKTPREAARTRVGRRKVDGVLKMMENSAARAAREGMPSYDFSHIRDELGIPPE